MNTKTWSTIHALLACCLGTSPLLQAMDRLPSVMPPLAGSTMESFLPLEGLPLLGSPALAPQMANPLLLTHLPDPFLHSNQGSPLILRPDGPLLDPYLMGTFHLPAAAAASSRGLLQSSLPIRAHAF